MGYITWQLLRASSSLKITKTRFGKDHATYLWYLLLKIKNLQYLLCRRRVLYICIAVRLDLITDNKSGQIWQSRELDSPGDFRYILRKADVLQFPHSGVADIQIDTNGIKNFFIAENLYLELKSSLNVYNEIYLLKGVCIFDD